MNADNAHPALLVDPAQRIFKVARRNFVDHEIYEAEKEKIFDRSWLYLGHSSELPKPGDYITRAVADRSILFTRDAKGRLRALMNTCPHRGAQVCRERKGNAKSFQCFYHGWVFSADGSCEANPARNPIPKTSRAARLRTCGPCPATKAIATSTSFPSIRTSFRSNNTLGNAKEYLDVICEPDRRRHVDRGRQPGIFDPANWKLLTENSIDGYHAMTTHASYFDILMNTTDNLSTGTMGGFGHDLGNGHAVLGVWRAMGTSGRAMDSRLGRSRQIRNRQAITTKLLERFERSARTGSR